MKRNDIFNKLLKAKAEKKSHSNDVIEREPQRMIKPNQKRKHFPVIAVISKVKLKQL